MNVRSPLLRGAIGTAVCAWLCAAYVSPARASDLQALLACRQVAPSAARLSCFDRESAALAEDVRAGAPHPAAATGVAGATGAAAATGAATSATANASRLNPQQTFGLAPMQVAAREAAAEQLPRQLDRLSAHITALGRAADGREIFTLDNHQVWAQLEPDESIIARAGDPVTISRGMFSSYWLSLPARQGCKVTRMR